MSVLTDPVGLTGTVGSPNQGQLHESFQSAEAATTIAKGSVVTITAARKVIQAVAGATYLAIGVTTEAIAPGNVGVVALYGVVTSVRATGAIAAGALVIPSATVAGTVDTAGAATTGIVGVAVAAAAGGIVTVFVFKA